MIFSSQPCCAVLFRYPVLSFILSDSFSFYGRFLVSFLFLVSRLWIALSWTRKQHTLGSHRRLFVLHTAAYFFISQQDSSAVQTLQYAVWTCTAWPLPSGAASWLSALLCMELRATVTLASRHTAVWTGARLSIRHTREYTGCFESVYFSATSTRSVRSAISIGQTKFWPIVAVYPQYIYNPRILPKLAMSSQITATTGDTRSI